METMEEVHSTTRKYGLKARGILAALEKFDVYFGLKLGHLLFGTAEVTSKVLQAKDTSMQEAVSAVCVTCAFYQHQRQEEAFDPFFDNAVMQAEHLCTGEPQLPRYRKPLKTFDGRVSHTNSAVQEASFIRNVMRPVNSLFNN